MEHKNFHYRLHYGEKGEQHKLLYKEEVEVLVQGEEIKNVDKIVAFRKTDPKELNRLLWEISSIADCTTSRVDEANLEHNNNLLTLLNVCDIIERLNSEIRKKLQLGFEHNQRIEADTLKS